MHWIDWTILVGFTAWIVFDGLKRTKDSHEIEGYFLANRSIPWWAAGISVMATQLSAITMIGTTGQGYNDGMRFIQFYYGLPVAMIILSVTLVPFFYRSGVYTAYEYLERRFDAKTRSFTSLLFLLSRGMSVGAVVSAPAVVLSLVLGWDLTATALAITMPAVVYTMFGGVQAVTWTDVKIMVLIVVGLFAMIAAAVLGLPAGIGLGDGLGIAAATGRLRSFDFSWDLTNQYTFWSGTIAALFLFCSYFGTDQSQVQRYLTARSEEEAKRSLLMSAYWKIPLQVLVLLLGILVFVFYVFNTPPLIFSSAQQTRLKEGPAAAQYAALESEFGTALDARRAAGAALAAARDTGDEGQVAAARADVRRAQRGGGSGARQGDGAGARDDRRPVVHRRELHHPDVHPDPASDRADRHADRGHSHGGDRHHRRRAQLAVDGDGDRFLQAPLQTGGLRRPLPAGLQGGDRRLGVVCLRGRGVGGGARLADRGGQPLRIVLLRLDPRRLHPRGCLSPRHRHRRVHRADCRAWPRWRGWRARRTSRSCGTTSSARLRSWWWGCSSAWRSGRSTDFGSSSRRAMGCVQ